MVTTRYYDQREQFTENPDVFTYDELPDPFRVKVAYALSDLFDAVGERVRSGPGRFPQTLWKDGVVRALGIPGDETVRDLHGYFRDSDVSQFFIGLEVALEKAAEAANTAGTLRNFASENVADTHEAINTLFGYFGLGYEIVWGSDAPPFQVIRKDTQYTHQEAVKPALALLADGEFEQAESQFREAHREFQQGNYGDAITDASSAFETVLKVALNSDEGTAKDLLNKAAADGYFPGFLESSTSQWVNLMLELPTVRNRMGDAHGKPSPPDEREMERFARLALNLAAAHILFIVDEYKRRRGG